MRFFIFSFSLFFSYQSLVLSASSPRKRSSSFSLKKAAYYLTFPLEHLTYAVNKKISWWDKIEEGLVLGAMPLKKHLSDIKSSYPNLAVLSLIKPFEMKKSFVADPITAEQWAEEGIPFKQLVASDYGPVAQEKITESLSFIREQRAQGKTVYVHCKAGKGRSATVVMTYLMSMNSNLKPLDALSLVRFKRPQIRPNTKQMDSVYAYYHQVLHPFRGSH